MKSYTLSDTALKLKGTYLEPIEMSSAILNLTHEELYGFVQLWLTEGIPFLFRNCPFVYENMRLMLAKRISIHPKQITIIGSARIGYSMAPIEFGRAINNNSDLDFTIVSESIFENCKTEFLSWESDFNNKIVLPKNEKERNYWIANVKHVPGNIYRGFINTYNVPSYPQYPTITQINDSSWRLIKATRKILNDFNIAKISFRVYKDWDHFINQMVFNLNYSKDKLK